MSAQDHEHEPIPGLPHELPPGESIVWQGGPAWRSVARHVFKIRWVAGYFVAMLFARGAMAFSSGEDATSALGSLALMTTLFGAALGVLALLGWMHARSTIYTITTHRVVMRIGPALAMTWNLPFRRIVSADLLSREDGLGDIVLRVDEAGSARAWLLWPHVEPGRLLDARPALRCLPDAERVARTLKDAVVTWSRRNARDVQVAPQITKQPAPTLEPSMALESH
jgi:hypothetical protein